MLQRRTLLLALTAGGLLAACGGGSGDSPFEPSSYSGSLSGTGSGSFDYTVQDAAGNAAGSATVAGQSFTLAGYVSNGNVNLQFQGQSQFNGWITGAQTSGGMSGSWYLSGASYYEGSASASTTASAGGGGGSCTSLIGYWTETTSGLNHWNFISDTQAQVIQASTNYPGGVLTTDLALTAVSSSSITYMITNQKMTGTGAYDYSYDQAAMTSQGLNVGPFSAGYTLANCQLTIGGQTYGH